MNPLTILLRTKHGWTDYLGCGDNQWSTYSDAQNAIKALEEVGFSKDPSDWKIILTSDLSNYSIVS